MITKTDIRAAQSIEEKFPWTGVSTCQKPADPFQLLSPAYCQGLYSPDKYDDPSVSGGFLDCHDDAFSYHSACDDFLSSAFDSGSSCDNLSSTEANYNTRYVDIPSRNLEAQLDSDRSPAMSVAEELGPLAYHSQPVTPTESATTLPEFLTHNIGDDSLATRKAYLDNTYDTSSVMYDKDDVSMFNGLVNCDDVLQTPSKICYSEQERAPLACTTNFMTNDPFATTKPVKIEHIIPDNQTIHEQHVHLPKEPSSDDSKKGKITGLQRAALDSIFAVTDRPSRGLVLLIGSELRLHHITVKNFFSNGRRRLRRAAARLNDPERTIRENLRRKEKRRLAALAVAACVASKDKGILPGSKTGSPDGQGSQPQRDPPVLSPQRKALMEKLAVKVQRSAAQKNFVSNSHDIRDSPPQNTTPPVVYGQELKRVQIEHQPEIHSKAADTFRSFRVQPENFFVEKSVLETALHFDDNDPVCTTSHYFSANTNPTAVSNSFSPMPDNALYTDTDDGPFSPTSWQTLLHS